MQTLPNVRTFTPELWGEVDKFAQFFAQTYPDFKPDVKKAVSGVWRTSKKRSSCTVSPVSSPPNLALDAAELEERGFTPAAKLSEPLRWSKPSSLSSTRPSTAHARSSWPSIISAAGFRIRRGSSLPSCPKERSRIFPDELRSAFLAASWYCELPTSG